MPKLSGVFSQFKNLDKISPSALNRWLRIKKDPQFLINFLGNRIIYPQTIGVNPLDMEIDLAILREALKEEPQGFYFKEQKKIEVPIEFLQRFVPEFKLLAAIIDGISPDGLVEIILKGNGPKKTLASCFKPQISPEKNLIEALIGGKSFKLLPNTLTLIPCTGGEQSIKIDGLSEVKFNTGNLGIFIDLRGSS